MSDLRTAALRALEYMKSVGQMDMYPEEWAIVERLEAALAEPDIDPVDEYRKGFIAGQIDMRDRPEEQQEPVAWTGYDLEGMVEAFSQVIEAHHSSKHPFHNPIDMDAKMALRILRGFIPAMKAYATPPQRPAPIIQPEIKDDKPFGYFRAEPFGWTDCAPTDEGAIPLYERPQQPPTPPEAQTEAEKVAYCAGWWAALEAERKELLRIAEEQQ